MLRGLVEMRECSVLLYESGWEKARELEMSPAQAGLGVRFGGAAQASPSLRSCLPPQEAQPQGQRDQGHLLHEAEAVLLELQAR